MSKLKPILFLAAAGGVVVALRKRAGANDSGADGAPRYAAPAEAGAQPPTEAGGPPADEPRPSDTTPAEDLQTKAHDLPAGAVMPDTSKDDASVQEAEDAAAADAAAIGQKGDETQP
jgi:hypothetical protein